MNEVHSQIAQILIFSRIILAWTAPQCASNWRWLDGTNQDIIDSKKKNIKLTSARAAHIISSESNWLCLLLCTFPGRARLSILREPLKMFLHAKFIAFYSIIIVRRAIEQNIIMTRFLLFFFATFFLRSWNKKSRALKKNNMDKGFPKIYNNAT